MQSYKTYGRALNNYKGMLDKNTVYRIIDEGYDWYRLVNLTFVPKFVMGLLSEEDMEPSPEDLIENCPVRFGERNSHLTKDKDKDKKKLRYRHGHKPTSSRMAKLAT